MQPIVKVKLLYLVSKIDKHFFQKFKFCDFFTYFVIIMLQKRFDVFKKIDMFA